MDRLNVRCRCTPLVDVRYDPETDGHVVETLAEAITEASGTDSTELPPLYDAIDTDALAQLVENHDGAARSNAVLGFEYGTWNVFVRADGRIRVCDGLRHAEDTPVTAD